MGLQSGASSVLRKGFTSIHTLSRSVYAQIFHEQVEPVIEEDMEDVKQDPSTGSSVNDIPLQVESKCDLFILLLFVNQLFI
jgi:hypothetical protein